MSRVHRILAVDDNLEVLRVQAALLRAMGHEVCPAANGDEALEAVDGFHPDVIMLDIGLPGMSGYDLARYFRSEPSTSGVWLIAITGYGSAEARRKAFDAGFDEHFVKPVSLAELSRALND
jgi:CheY-like chemotaxis protein